MTTRGARPPLPPEEAEARIIDLEIQLTHQNHLLEELNGEIIRQDGLIKQLTLRLARLEKVVEEGAGDKR